MKSKPTAKQLFTRFETGLCEAALKTDPDNLVVLMTLGYAYTREGLYEKALAVDKKVVELLPEDPTAYYNLACDYSLLKMLDEAFAELELACRLGYKDFEHLEKDSDMENLRQDPRYQQILNMIGDHLSAG